MSDIGSYVMYNGKRLIPSPRLSFNDTYERSGDGGHVGINKTVTISGKFLAGKGWTFDAGGNNPTLYDGSGYPSDGNAYSFVNILDMQEAVRSLFALDNEYKWFEVQCPPNQAKKWRGRVLSVNFPNADEEQDANWTHACSYEIQLELQVDNEADAIEQNYRTFRENWDVQYNRDKGGTYALSHTVQCDSREFYDEVDGIVEGWKKAKAYLDGRLAGAEYDADGVKTALIYESTGFNIDGHSAYDYQKNESLTEFDGSYAITETWTLSPAPIYRRINASYQKQLSGDEIVTLDGTFSVFDGPTSYDTLETLFDNWLQDDANGPYSIAASYHTKAGGCGSLQWCPRTTSLKWVKTDRVADDGAVTGVYEAEEARTINFTLEYVTGENCVNVSYTTAVNENVAECENTVVISGTIQGLSSTSLYDDDQCDCDCTDAWQRVLSKYTTFDNTTMDAEAVSYVADAERVSTNVTYNEKATSIQFTYQYSDRYDGGLKTTQTVRTNKNVATAELDGSFITTYTVEGEIVGLCSISWASVLAAIPTPAAAISGVTSDDVFLQSQSTTQNQVRNSASYSYQYTTGTSPASIQLTVRLDEPEGMGDEDPKLTLDYTIQGHYVDDSTSLISQANAALTALDPDTTAASYLTTPVRASTSISRNINAGTINASYMYGKTAVTVTERADERYGIDLNGCQFRTMAFNVSIAGRNAGGGGADAYTSANNYFNANYTTAQVLSSTGLSYITSRSVQREYDRGSISASFELVDSESPCKHDQEIGVEKNVETAYSTITVSGTITPYCTCMEDGCSDDMLTIAEASWDTVEAALPTQAAAALSGEGETGSLVKIRSSVNRNQNNGSIRYSYVYVNRGSFCLTGYTITDEELTIDEDEPASVVAQVVVPGRALGPIVEDKNTVTIRQATVRLMVSIDIDPEVCYYTPPAALKTAVTNQMDSIRASLNSTYGTTNSWTISDKGTWGKATGRYIRTQTMIFEEC